ncbi:hypothetical protein M0805_009128 [Coniferiporia weirii]|nr:hypothetical protein M0805_009128 [Coniferiporia weirii]
MVLKVYGTSFTMSTHSVIATLKELNLDYEFIPVDIRARENKTEEYLAQKHPFGKVPTLVEEDGFTVYESHAISRHLVNKYGHKSGLVPKDDYKKVALFEQALAIQNSYFHTFAFGVSTEQVFKPMRGQLTDKEREAEYVEALKDSLKAYEVILSKQKYLAGDEFTLADLFHLPYGTVLTEYTDFTGLEATPNVARWWKDIYGRPSWQSVITSPGAALTGVSKKERRNI